MVEEEGASVREPRGGWLRRGSAKATPQWLSSPPRVKDEGDGRIRNEWLHVGFDFLSAPNVRIEAFSALFA